MKLLSFLFIGLVLCLFSIFGDFLIKKATLKEGFSGWKLLLGGASVYAVTALGWFLAMKKMKLSTIGVLYSLFTVLFLTLVGVFYFHEKINGWEILGIFLAIISLVFLYRFG